MYFLTTPTNVMHCINDYNFILYFLHSLWNSISDLRHSMTSLGKLTQVERKKERAPFKTYALLR